MEERMDKNGNIIAYDLNKIDTMAKEATAEDNMVTQKVVKIMNTTKNEFEYHVVPEGFVGTEASEEELKQIAKLAELAKTHDLEKALAEDKETSINRYFSTRDGTYTSVAAPHLQDKEVEKEEPKPKEVLLWKNPKSRVKNNKVVEKGDNVLVHEKPLYLVVTKIFGDGNCRVEGINGETESFEISCDMVYPIYSSVEDTIKVGNLIEYNLDGGIERGIVTKIEKDEIISHGVRIPREAVTRIYTRNQPKVPCSTYTCGAVLFRNKTYESFKELADLYPGTKFLQEQLLYPLEFMNIAEHYKIAANEVKPKDKDISKLLKRTLNHPLNVAKKEWAILVGPSGSGKTEMAISYADEEGKSYVKVQGTAQLTVDDLIGYKSLTTGNYISSLLRDAVENGKIFIIDEIDACNPNTLLVLNGLKQEYYQFPDTLVKIHKDFKLIATANTLEFNEEYNARTPVDKATKTRFKVIEYDMTDMELAVRYGLKYIKRIKNIDRLTPREVDRMVTDMIIDEMEAEEATRTKLKEIVKESRSKNEVAA
jgi:hypothetical protein